MPLTAQMNCHMNILVTGANGQLGTEMRNVCKESGNKYVFTDVNTLPGVDTVYLDITNIDAIRITAASENIDVIVNCAAYTDVAKAEDDLDFANMLNNTAVSNLASVAAERGATIIHISTDYVFGGDSTTPYKEDDPKNPLGVYGSTKLAGEGAILNAGCNYMIFRTAWLYSPYGRNFVKTMKKLTSERDVTKVVFDQVGTPTYAKDLAALIHDIISNNLLDRKGIYHFSDEGVCSWYDFATEIALMCGNEGKVVPCHSDEFPSKVRRPSFSVLDKTLVKKTFGIEIPHWRISLADCIKRLETAL